MHAHILHLYVSLIFHTSLHRPQAAPANMKPLLRFPKVSQVVPLPAEASATTCQGCTNTISEQVMGLDERGAYTSGHEGDVAEDPDLSPDLGEGLLYQQARLSVCYRE